MEKLDYEKIIALIGFVFARGEIFKISNDILKFYKQRKFITKTNIQVVNNNI